jgi:3'(2'), 5'-bisphosphate nucleotidase
MSSDGTPETDVQLATRLATEAGHMLLALRQRMFGDEAEPWQIKDAGDAVSQTFLADELERTRPDDAVLSEEGLEDPRRFDADRVWIVDPLDGTREFSERGRVDWAVHVALWDRDHFGAGAVSLPALAMTLATDPPPILPEVDREHPRLVTSRTRPPRVAAIVAHALQAEPLALGSAGAKTMAVVMGDADIYIHAGGQYQWDSAAPAAVAEAAGLHVSRIDGSPLVYNDRDPWLPDFLVCRKQYTEPILTALWG